MQALLRAAGWIDRLSGAFASVVRWALLANALLITGTAFSRTFLSMAWTDAFDMQWQFFAAVVLLMAAYTLQRDEHVRIDIFAHRLGERGLAWLDLFGIALVLLPVCVAMIWVSWPDFHLCISAWRDTLRHAKAPATFQHGSSKALSLWAFFCWRCRELPKVSAALPLLRV